MIRTPLFLTLVLLAACKGDDSINTDDSVPDDSVPQVDEDGDGYVSSEDCDDSDAAINPGAVEACDGLDNNCDGSVDEGVLSTWYADTDADGYGSSESVEACEAPTGFVAETGDCDDGDERFYPGAEESDCNDPNDYNCDGSVGYADNDGDGYAACQECDDTTAGTNPGATETCDSVDNNCDGSVDENLTSTFYQDADADGWGDADYVQEACEQPAGYASQAGDCDDSVGEINPDATEVCNGSDDDCDGSTDEPDAADSVTWYQDFDGDSYGDADYSTQACDQPTGYVADSEDCDDGSSDVNPGAVEQCNGVDDNCDGSVDEEGALGESTWYQDMDADGYGDADYSTISCDEPSGYAADSTDCDDSEYGVNPGADELCNNVDDNCDGTIDEASAIDASTWYADLDGDGFGDVSSSVVSCDAPSGYGSDSSDCDDSSDWTYPGAAEIRDSSDNDCDGSSDEDLYLGDGSDGALSVSGTVDLGSDPSGTRTEADAIAWPVTAISGDTLTVSGTVSGLDPGDEVIIINAHGSDSAYTNVGTYEFATVTLTGSSSITLAQNLTETFGQTSNTDLTGQSIFVQRVPHYSKVTVSSGGVLTTGAWDGSTGGVLAFRCNGTVRVDSGGGISADSLGYAGGATGSAYNCDSYQGESYAGEGEGEGNGACNAYNEAYGQWIYNYGGGGAHINGGGGNHGGGATAGSSWTGGSATAPYAGLTYGSADLSSIFFGSGGGGVWNGNSSCTGSGPGPGGDGAGIVIITASKINLLGNDGVTAMGGSTTHCAQGSWTYGAGGGAGGSVWLGADTVSLAADSVSAEGGAGEQRNIRVGGNGGYGRVRVDCNTCNTYKNGSSSATTALNAASEPNPGYSSTL